MVTMVTTHCTCTEGWTGRQMDKLANRYMYRTSQPHIKRPVLTLYTL